MTANDYANIQRMIDQSILAAIGRELQPDNAARNYLQVNDKHDYTGVVATFEDLNELERDLEQSIDDHISDVQHSVNRLERQVESIEGGEY